ncbi:hypothetical protein EG329_000455 [Mollisiaceae sp. DMI_Dod_QoI]|nr:hypothetical protein EG329_000455 [Helotiales sp. DMI_Dod_QoI]
MSFSGFSTRAHQGSVQSLSPSSSTRSTSSSNDQQTFSSQRIATYLKDPIGAQPPCRMHHVVEDKGDPSAARRAQAELDELEAMMAREMNEDHYRLEEFDHLEGLVSTTVAIKVDIMSLNRITIGTLRVLSVDHIRMFMEVT